LEETDGLRVDTDTSSLYLKFSVESDDKPKQSPGITEDFLPKPFFAIQEFLFNKLTAFFCFKNYPSIVQVIQHRKRKKIHTE